MFCSTKDNLFEFYRNKEFFENLLNSKIDIKKPYFITGDINLPEFAHDKYVVIVPGSQDKDRIWDINHFASVARFIIDNYKMKIIISGSEKERYITDLLYSKLDIDSVYNIPVSVPLSILVKYIENAQLIISNDTGPAHIAVAVGTPLICIANGDYLGRFHPYPKEIFSDAFYIYPKKIKSLIDSGDFRHSHYRLKSKININEIAPDEVITFINKILISNA